MSGLTPPVLAGQMKSSDKEVASAQEKMAQIFQNEQESRAAGNEVVQAAKESGEDIQLHVYNCRLPSCHYVFKDGSQATFVAGVFKTANPYEIEQLDAECRRGHPHIFIDKNAPAVVSAKLDADPIAALKAKIRAEILAEGDPKDFGTNPDTASKILQPAGTNQVAAAVAGGMSSTGQPLPASLMAALRK